MCLLRSNIISKPFCFIGAGNGVLPDGFIADDRCAYCTVHYDERRKLEDDPDFAGRRASLDS